MRFAQLRSPPRREGGSAAAAADEKKSCCLTSTVKKNMLPHLDLAMEGMEGTKAEAVAAVARAKMQEDFMVYA